LHTPESAFFCLDNPEKNSIAEHLPFSPNEKYEGVS